MQQSPEFRRSRRRRALELEQDGFARESLAGLEALAAEVRDSPELLAISDARSASRFARRRPKGC